MAHQTATSRDGVQADDNIAWIDPSIDLDIDTRDKVKDDVVSKVTTQHVQIIVISRATHVHVVCAREILERARNNEC